MYTRSFTIFQLRRTCATLTGHHSPKRHCAVRRIGNPSYQAEGELRVWRARLQRQDELDQVLEVLLAERLEAAAAQAVTAFDQ